ncbi:ribonuclease J [Patescibacteria group bacterium]|nr:ribonuclease J [Patescibacteria group bacterium]MBU2159218.1 ribonuclease J [Patescibacteria group bacterium]MBU2220651.1 ribonuclease J [Patescibacteria group bacterium]
MSAPAPAPAPAPHGRAAHPAPTGPRQEGPTEGARPSRPRGRGKEGGTRPTRRPMMRRQGPQAGNNSAPAKKAPDYFPEAPGKDVVRVVPLGGVEEVGRNMFTIETNGDIFVFDVGFQFVSEDTSPGVDYVLPNTRYLEMNKDRIRGVFITHGHLDHIGGIPFLMNRMGNPTIYTQNLSAVMIKKRQEEYPDQPELNIVVVDPGSTMTIGSTKVQFFPVTHSIPDSMGIAVSTPYGNVIATGDLKLDHENGIPTEVEAKKWGALGAQKNLLFIADSTNAERDGFSVPERKVHETLEEIIRTVKGRLIIGTFASQFERMVRIIEISESLGKKVITEGRSIKTNLEIAQKTGLLTVKKDTIISSQEIGDYPPDKIVILSTGAQGEEFAALMRIATKQHKSITLNSRDTIVLSSSVIPGNEISVQKLKDNLYRNGVTLIHYRSSDVHSTGHGNTGELIWINQQVGAKYFMPAYGYYSMTASHARAVEQAGRPRESIILADNGMVIDIEEGGEKLNYHKQKVPSAPLVVDGFSIGDLQEVVIRDRQMLAKDGMFVIIATVNLKTGKLRKSPDIISRGFVYLRENQEMLNQARLLIKKTVEDSTEGMNPVDLDYVKNALSDTMAGYLFTRTNKAPMVIPVLIGV